MKNKYTSVLVGVGAGIEFYDFAIFAFYASYLNSEFFPSQNSLIYIFLVFALGYLTRPLGALIFGYIGDKYGRKKSFTITMFLISIASLALGSLPSFKDIGHASVILFIFFRCLQGVCYGGEIPSAITYITESYEKKNGFHSSILFAGVMSGMLLSSFVYYILNIMSIHNIIDSNNMWRCAFILGGVFTLIIYFLRKNLKESVAFINSSNSFKLNRVEIKHFFKNVFAAILLMSFIAMVTTQLVILMPSFLINIGYTSDGGLLIFCTFLMIISCIVSGLISDVCNKKYLYLILISSLILNIILFYMMAVQHNLLWKLFLVISSVIYGMLPSTYPVILSEAFKTKIRCTGVGISFNIAYSIFSAPVPMITMLFIHKFGTLIIPLYLIAICFIFSLIGFIILASCGRSDKNARSIIDHLFLR